MTLSKKGLYVTLGIRMICFYAESHFIYYYAECRSTECRYAECHYAECRYTECRYAECHGAGFEPSNTQVYLPKIFNKTKCFISSGQGKKTLETFFEKKM